jgi:hypothetical protein
MDPLNAYAVAGMTQTSHDNVASQMEQGAGGLYSMVWASRRCRRIPPSPG